MNHDARMKASEARVLAAFSAVGLLQVMVDQQRVPAPYVELARRVMAEFNTANDALLAIDQEKAA